MPNDSFFPAQEFIHLPSIGDVQKCNLYFKELTSMLKKKLEESKIMGYHIITIKNLDDVNDHFIETDYTSITKGQFPFLYLFLQPLAEFDQIENIVEGLNLVQLKNPLA